MKILDIKDRFARSFVAGLLSSLIAFGLNLFSYYVLHFSNRRYINYSALMIYGRKFNNLSEAILSSISQILFATGLIIIFSYVILKEDGKNFILRGGFVGFGSWFAIMSFSYIMGINKILPQNTGAGISFVITATIWGILGAWFLRILDERYSTSARKRFPFKDRGKNEI